MQTFWNNYAEFSCNYTLKKPFAILSILLMLCDCCFRGKGHLYFQERGNIQPVRSHSPCNADDIVNQKLRAGASHAGVEAAVSTDVQETNEPNVHLGLRDDRASVDLLSGTINRLYLS